MQLRWELTGTNSAKNPAFSESVFCKKPGLREGGSQKGPQGRHSKGNKAVSKVLEVVFTEDLASAELALLAVTLESNEPPPGIPAS